jgi:hypothetical protein
MFELSAIRRTSGLFIAMIIAVLGTNFANDNPHFFSNHFRSAGVLTFFALIGLATVTFLLYRKLDDGDLKTTLAICFGALIAGAVIYGLNASNVTTMLWFFGLLAIVIVVWIWNIVLDLSDLKDWLGSKFHKGD